MPPDPFGICPLTHFLEETILFSFCDFLKQAEEEGDGNITETKQKKHTVSKRLELVYNNRSRPMQSALEQKF